MREVQTKSHRRTLLQRAFPRWSARRSEWALRGEAAELQREVLPKMVKAFAKWQGASKNSPYADWSPGGGSADEDLLDDLPRLRERSRDLARSDMTAAGLIDTWVSNIVGTGLVPQARVDRDELRLTEAQATAYQKAAERAYARWSKSVDVTRRLTAGEFQDLTLRSMFTNGDVFVIPRPKGRGRYKLAAQIVEADRVTTPTSKSTDEMTREGVKIGPDGEHLAYYVKKTHPGDSLGFKQDDFSLIQADDDAGREQVHQIYKVRRPDQTRGSPFLAPALLAFKDLNQYQRAELIAAKVAACYALYIVVRDPLGEATRAASSTTTTAGDGAVEMLEPGTISRLRPGEEIQSFNPNRPNTAYGDFVKSITRGIGASVQMSYEQITQDFSSMNYSSARVILMEVRRVYRGMQAWLAQKLLQPLYERLMEEAYLLGDLPAPGFLSNVEGYTRALWVGPGWSWVDPAKEVDATISSINANLSTLSGECAARGLDWEETLEQRAREKARMEELGLEMIEVVGGGGKQEDQDDGDEDEDEDGSDDDE